MLLASLLLAACTVLAVSVPTSDAHDHSVRRSLGGQWYHEPDHPVHNLFRRSGQTDGITYPAVGSLSEYMLHCIRIHLTQFFVIVWGQNFPSGTPDSSQLPKAWLDALTAAVNAGKIPDVPIAESEDGADPKYPDDLDPMSPQICSSTYKCINNLAWWDGPEGYYASSFDDGPQPVSIYALLTE